MPECILLAGDISEYIEQVFLPDDSFVLVKLSARRIRLLQLEVTMDSILRAVQLAKLPMSLKNRQVRSVGKTMILVRPGDDEGLARSMALHCLKYSLASVVVKGTLEISLPLLPLQACRTWCAA